MSIINLQRDAVFIAPEKTVLDFGTVFNVNEATDATVNTDPVVYDAYTQARCSRTNSTSTGTSTGQSFGVLMKPPGLELTPYRIKAYAFATAAQSFSILIGFAEGTITGSDDVITHWQTLPFDKEFDELVMVESALTTGDSPIFVGIMVQGTATGRNHGSISVQRLATSPPQFSQSVS